jgi:Flp pilus assembly protein TadG
MTGTSAELMRDVRGVAGVEFVLTAPILILLLAGLADFGLAFWHKGVLASSVAEGASYADIAGPTVNTSTIKSIVGQKLALPASSVTITGPMCYCVSGTPATAAVQTCGILCTDGITPGKYITISAQYTYRSILPTFSRLVDPLLTESTMARLQ